MKLNLSVDAKSPSYVLDGPEPKCLLGNVNRGAVQGCRRQNFFLNDVNGSMLQQITDIAKRVKGWWVSTHILATCVRHSTWWTLEMRRTEEQSDKFNSSVHQICEHGDTAETANKRTLNLFTSLHRLLSFYCCALTFYCSALPSWIVSCLHSQAQHATFPPLWSSLQLSRVLLFKGCFV